VRWRHGRKLGLALSEVGRLPGHHSPEGKRAS
jgi:hypothetical protein